MTVWVAFLRGINVGGKHSVPMKALVAGLQTNGIAEVKTYIQSGNLVFRSDKSKSALAKTIAQVIENDFGFLPKVLVLSAKELAQAVAANPYAKAVADGTPESGKTVHLWFLTEPSKKPDLAALTTLKAASEDFALHGQVLYLFAPNGIGRSKFAEKVDKHLGVETTARNWNTISKVLELAT